MSKRGKWCGWLYPCVAIFVWRGERWCVVAKGVMSCIVLYCSHMVVCKSLKSLQCSNVPFLEKKRVDIILEQCEWNIRGVSPTGYTLFSKWNITILY